MYRPHLSALRADSRKAFEERDKARETETTFFGDSGPSFVRRGPRPDEAGKWPFTEDKWPSAS